MPSLRLNVRPRSLSRCTWREARNTGSNMYFCRIRLPWFLVPRIGAYKLLSAVRSLQLLSIIPGFAKLALRTLATWLAEPFVCLFRKANGFAMQTTSGLCREAWMRAETRPGAGGMKRSGMIARARGANSARIFLQTMIGGVSEGEPCLSCLYPPLTQTF